MNSTADFMTRDLPDDTRFTDQSGLYRTQFAKLWLTDDDDEWSRILEMYRSGGETERRIINDVFVSLVGYTLPSIVDQAHAEELPNPPTATSPFHPPTPPPTLKPPTSTRNRRPAHACPEPAQRAPNGPHHPPL